MLWRLKGTLTPSTGENMLERRLQDKKGCLSCPVSHLLPDFKVTGVLQTVPTSLQGMHVHQWAGACVHAGGSWFLKKCTTALLRRALRGVDPPRAKQGPPRARASSLGLNFPLVHLWVVKHHEGTAMTFLNYQSFLHRQIHIPAYTPIPPPPSRQTSQSH